jgi:hypothetical protein
MRRVLAQAERVTVGRCAGDATNRKGAACARHVLDDDRLTEKRLHPFGEIARDHVGRTSRGIGHDDGDRPRRIGLRPCNARNGRECGSTGGQMQKSTAGKFHSVLPAI